MKIRFLHEDIKVLVTRISGLFNIEIDRENNLWDNKTTRGSFRILSDDLYDEILDKISKMRNTILIELRMNNDIPGRSVWFNEVFPFPQDRWRGKEMSYLIFEIRKGKIVKVDVENPKQKIGPGPNTFFVYSKIYKANRDLTDDQYSFLLENINLILEESKKPSPHKTTTSRKERRP